MRERIFPKVEKSLFKIKFHCSKVPVQVFENGIARIKVNSSKFCDSLTQVLKAHSCLKTISFGLSLGGGVLIALVIYCTDGSIGLLEAMEDSTLMGALSFELYPVQNCEIESTSRTTPIRIESEQWSA